MQTALMVDLTETASSAEEGGRDMQDERSANRGVQVLLGAIVAGMALMAALLLLAMAGLFPIDEASLLRLWVQATRGSLGGW